jgi:hypothetical protein
MIEIQATAYRTFVFPASLALAQQFYSDFRRIALFLPHISLVRSYDSRRFRLLYSTTESGVYKVRLFVDVETELDDKHHVLHIRSAEKTEPVGTRVGLRSLTAQGRYTSQSIFHPEDDQTRIDYHVQLAAELPRPVSLALMPDSVLNHIVDSIARRRIKEIVDGFITQSTTGYPNWLASSQERADSHLG